MLEKPDIHAAVGRTLNRLRTDRGLTVTALARAAGVSPAMVSRIEAAQVSPSLATISALAGALQVPEMALLAQHDAVADIHHVRAGAGLPARRLTPGHSHDFLLLGRHENHGWRFEAAHIRIEAAAAGHLPVYQHEGHAFLRILSGAAVYRCGGQEFELAPGDSLSFDAKLPHGVARITACHVAFVSVSSRPV